MEFKVGDRVRWVKSARNRGAIYNMKVGVTSGVGYLAHKSSGVSWHWVVYKNPSTLYVIQCYEDELTLLEKCT